MNILIRLHSKLGSTIMSFAFLDLLHEQYPNAVIDVIMQKPIAELHKYKHYINTCYAFSKKEYKGVSGLYRFGRMIRRKRKYDLYITLPLSFSSALMGFFSGCTSRIGFKSEFRSFLLTHSYKMPAGLHAVKQFENLLSNYMGKKLEIGSVKMSVREMETPALPDGKTLLINVNSGSQTRRLPVYKAISLINGILEEYDFNIILIGGPGEVDFVRQIESNLKEKSRVINFTGKTDLHELASLMKRSDLMISTDSGNAHLANAVGLKMVVLMGGCAIGGEAKPYNRERIIFIEENLPCAPCWPSENCKFGDPLCLLKLENRQVFNAIDQLMSDK